MSNYPIQPNEIHAHADESGKPHLTVALPATCPICYEALLTTRISENEIECHHCGWQGLSELDDWTDNDRARANTIHK